MGRTPPLPPSQAITVLRGPYPTRLDTAAIVSHSTLRLKAPCILDIRFTAVFFLDLLFNVDFLLGTGAMMSIWAPLLLSSGTVRSNHMTTTSWAMWVVLYISRRWCRYRPHRLHAQCPPKVPYVAGIEGANERNRRW